MELPIRSPKNSLKRRKVSMDFVDTSGEPRPDVDLEQALQAVKVWIVKEPTAMGPDGLPRVIHLIVIKDALEELLALRRAHGSNER
jgi:hypothetical protein